MLHRDVTFLLRSLSFSISSLRVVSVSRARVSVSFSTWSSEEEEDVEESFSSLGGRLNKGKEERTQKVRR